MSGKRKADRTPSRLGLALLGKLERYMVRAGLITFMAEPTDAAPAGGATSPADATPSAGGTPPADAKPADGGATPPADAKPEGAAPDGKPADAKPQGAPEAYTDFTLPEGVNPDAALLDKFKATAKELNLTQEGAQKVVSMHAEHQAAQFRQTVQAWGEQAQADPEIGGDKFAENLAVSKKALEQFASPAFVDFLNKSGLGNHPEMIRAFYKAGKAISEDGFVPGRSGVGSADPARVMFPSMK